MTQAPARNANYLAQFQAQKQATGHKDAAWLRQLRQRAWESFAELGFPVARRGNEPWKYTNVRPIATADFQHPLDLTPEGAVTNAQFQASAAWQPDWINLVFIDGRFSGKLSSNLEVAGRVTVSSLAEILAGDGSLVENHLAKYALVESDGFVALNTAFLQDGAFIYVPDNVELATPVNLVYLTTDRQQPRVVYPRTLVVAGANSKLTLVESYVSLSQERYFTNAVTEIVLGSGANVDHYRLLHESADAFHVGTSRVYQGQDSSFTSGAFAMGAAIARNDFFVTQGELGGFTSLNGLYFTKGSEHIDNFVNINHTRPHGTSRLFYKGILDGQSKAIFGGTVFVQREAQKTDAQQTDKNLLLSDEAEVDSKPSLFIYADDVKCGHGATAGHIDETTLFYMRSRGLDLETASRFLIHAFAREIIETCQVEPLREYLDQRFMESIPRVSLRIGSTR